MIRENYSRWLYLNLLRIRVWPYRIILCFWLRVISAYFKYRFNTLILVRTFSGGSSEETIEIFFRIEPSFVCSCGWSCGEIFEIVRTFRRCDRIFVHRRVCGCGRCGCSGCFSRCGLFSEEIELSRCKYEEWFLCGCTCCVFCNLFVILWRRCTSHVWLCCSIVTMCWKIYYILVLCTNVCTTLTEGRVWVRLTSVSALWIISVYLCLLVLIFFSYNYRPIFSINLNKCYDISSG